MRATLPFRRAAPVRTRPIVLGVSALAALALCAPDAGAQAVQNPANGHWYEKVPATGIAWTAARTAADAMTHLGLQGHLATVTDAAENAWIHANLAPSLNRHWLGGFQDKQSPTYAEPDEGWAWVTGETWGYEAWFPGEPNNFAGLEDFIAYDHNQPAWNDIHDAWSISAGYLVEYEDAPLLYCTAKTSSCGTQPSLSWSGTSSASSPSGFTVRAEHAKAQKFGLLVYSTAGRAALPFQGGILCIAPPLRRAVPVADTAGTPPACDGVLAMDLNAFAAGALGGNPHADLTTPGTVVDCQFWARDTPGNSLLSNGLEYTVGP